MKTNKIIFWIATGLLSLLMLFSSGMYIFNNGMVQGMFTALGFPAYIIYPLAILKLSGIAVITLSNWTIVKEWAYAGFFFNFLLAISAHVAVGDGGQFGAVMALILLIVSYVYSKKIA